ncbi:MAG TPA: PAS domain-containing protein, partial [Candidatus Goldiibacteriota bacterium]|nr:PAS domain-containing protein [Candidatus Goldiibacteriota bacterium]
MREIAWTNTVLKDKNGRIAGMLSSGNDITELKKARGLLSESEEKFNAALKASMSPYASVGVDGRILDCNRAAASMLGYGEREIIGRHIRSLMTPDSAKKALKALSVVIKKGYSYGGEYRLKRKGGKVLEVIISSAAVKDESGRFLRTISFIEDVTERKFMESVLRESEEKYRSIFDASNDAVFVVRLDGKGRPGKFIAVNSAACRQLGYTREELLKLSPSDITEKSAEPVKRSRDIRRGVNMSFEAVHVARDGRRIPVRINTKTFMAGASINILATARDITAEKKEMAEKAEKENLERLKASVWKLAADSGISENELVEGLLAIIGPGLDCERAVFSVLEGGIYTAQYEWRRSRSVFPVKGV